MRLHYNCNDFLLFYCNTLVFKICVRRFRKLYYEQGMTNSPNHYSIKLRRFIIVKCLNYQNGDELMYYYDYMFVGARRVGLAQVFQLSGLMSLQHSDGRVSVWLKQREHMNPSCLGSTVQVLLVV